MKTSPRLCRAILWLTLALLLGGCATTYIARRAQEKPGVLVPLDPAIRQRVLAGVVDQGWSKDMVYIAVGPPDRVTSKVVSSGTVEVWTYRNMPRPRRRHFRGLRLNLDAVTTARLEQLYRPEVTPRGMEVPILTRADLAALDAAWELPDLPMGTLYVFIYRDRVFRLALGR